MLGKKNAAFAVFNLQTIPIKHWLAPNRNTSNHKNAVSEAQEKKKTHLGSKMGHS